MRTITQKDLDQFSALVQSIQDISKDGMAVAGAAVATLNAETTSATTAEQVRAAAKRAEVIRHGLQKAHRTMAAEFVKQARRCFGLKPRWLENNGDFMARVCNMPEGDLLTAMVKNGIAVLPE
jgi:hypothetical protein